MFSSTVKRMDGDEVRWRPPSLLCIPLVLCGGFIFFVDIFQLHSFRFPTAQLSMYNPYLPKQEDLTGFFIKTEGCRIPYMDPYDATVKQYIYKENPVVCNKGVPPLMGSNLTYVFLLNSSLSAYGISDVTALSCWYHILLHHTNGNLAFIKQRVVFNRTAEITDEFIKVYCQYNGTKVYTDFFAFAPKKPKLKSRKDVSHLNVLVIGMDAVSRLNLHRQLPKTVRVLKDLKALDFLGYTKVADNTFPNLTPVLTGFFVDELSKICWFDKNEPFDKCPLLWKNYSAEGYATAFVEDASWMGIFNYVKKGFVHPPTDYYWGPLNNVMEHTIGNSHGANVYQCVGGRMVYQSFLEYIDKVTVSMSLQNIPLFAFAWGASLSHDFLNKPQLGDDEYAEFFTKLSTSKLLDNTVFIFMSDHGIRWGGIRSTYQGRLEDSMPFLYVVLPQSFKNTYKYAYRNMKTNKRRLTTPFDLHETLKDLLDPRSLTKRVLESRVSEKPKRGYSLFEAIPPTRNCDSAAIELHWCLCQETVDIDVNNQNVTEVAQFTVAYINKQLEGYAQCAKLKLADINNARVHSASIHNKHETDYTEDYTIAFRTVPGNANFEATVRQYLSNNRSVSYEVTGTISRTNLYGSQSRCITDFHLKLYCYCT